MEWHAERQLRLLHDMQSNYIDPQYGSGVAQRIKNKVSAGIHYVEDTVAAGIDVAKLSYLTGSMLKNKDYAVTIIGESFLILSEHFGCALTRRKQNNEKVYYDVSRIIDHLFQFLQEPDSNGIVPITKMLDASYKILQKEFENNYSNLLYLLNQIQLGPSTIILLVNDWIVEIMSRVLGCKYTHKDSYTKFLQTISAKAKEAAGYLGSTTSRSLYQVAGAGAGKMSKLKNIAKDAEQKAQRAARLAFDKTKEAANKIITSTTPKSPTSPKSPKSPTSPKSPRNPFSFLKKKSNRAETSKLLKTTYKGTESKNISDFIVLLLETILNQLIIVIFSNLKDALHSLKFATKSVEIGGKATYKFATDQYYLGKILFEIGSRLTAKPINIPVTIQERLLNNVTQSIHENIAFENNNYFFHRVKQLVEEKKCEGCEYQFWIEDESS